MYPLLDITKWDIGETLNVAGTKEKKWYRDPKNNRLTLFKLPISLTGKTSTQTTELSGELWAEKITSEIGKLLNIPVHDVDIGYIEADSTALDYYGVDYSKTIDNRIYGAICYSFLTENEEILIEGADMIMEFDQSYDRNKLRGDIEIYNYDLLLRVFNKYGFVAKLLEMLVFDTLIGNTDRHQDNFGMIRNEKTGILTFAPLYDNSSSIGRELLNKKILLMNTDSQMFYAYLHGRKSASRILWNEWSEKKINTFEFLRRVITMSPEIVYDIERIENIGNNEIETIVHNVPDEVMTEVKKNFVIKLIKYRRNHMLKEFL
jgi:hypothetical protein